MELGQLLGWQLTNAWKPAIYCLWK